MPAVSERWESSSADADAAQFGTLAAEVDNYRLSPGSAHGAPTPGQWPTVAPEARDLPAVGATADTHPRPEDADRADASAPDGSLLIVATGRHAGCSLELDRDATVLIGSGEDQDVILEDPGIVSSHLAVLVMADAVALEAREGSLSLDDGRVLEPGERAVLQMPVRATIGINRGRGVLLVFDDAEVRRDQRGRRVSATAQEQRSMRGSRVAIASLSVGLIALGGGILALGATSPEGWRTGLGAGAVTAAAAAPELGEAALPVDTAAMYAQPTAEETVGALQGRLEEAGLSDLGVGLDGDVIHVTGMIAEEAQPQLRQVRHWFDATYGSRLPLLVDVGLVTPQANLPQPPAGVWLGRNPHIIDHLGQRHEVGSITPDGWMIDGIDAEGIRMSRGGHQITVTLE